MARHAPSKHESWFARFRRFIADVAEDVLDSIVDRLFDN